MTNRDMGTMHDARGAAQRLEKFQKPWICATDAAATFVLTLARLGWGVGSARFLVIHDGDHRLAWSGAENGGKVGGPSHALAAQQQF